jgi:hypothetical protein
VLTPARLHATETGKSFSFAFEGDSYRLRTWVGEFDVPAFFDDRTRMDRLTSVLDDSVEAGLSETGFIRRLENDAALTPEERAQGETALTGLYRRLRELHDTGLNGVWARIKNAFAPIFLEPGDYVVGNPPWVNWEHLPDEYRRSTMPLWEHYGLSETAQGDAYYPWRRQVRHLDVDDLCSRRSLPQARRQTGFCTDPKPLQDFRRRAGIPAFLVT